MIKHQGNIVEAIKSLHENKNNAVSHVYSNVSFSEGPLNNATVTIKDLFATDDAPTQASSNILKGFTPKYNATVINKIKNSGAAIVGKTHMDELALGGTGLASAFGEITNPLDSKRIIGGSSSGAAATLNKHISIALGSDTGDSVRLPASYVGKVGFKPSYGAVSRFGMFPFASSLDTVGWLTHNVNDAYEMAKVLYGQDQMDMTSKDVQINNVASAKPTKVAVLKNIMNVLDEKQHLDFTNLINKLKADGITVEEVEISQEYLDAILIVYSIISYAEVSSNDANLTGVIFGNRRVGKNWSEIMSNTRTAGFGNLVQRRLTLGAYFLAIENQKDIYERALKVRRLIVEAFNRIYDSFDALIYPATRISPLITESKKNDWFDNILTHSNLEGSPSITIPFGTEDSMPYGLAIDSKIYNDEKLLSYALYIESLLGGVHE